MQTDIVKEINNYDRINNELQESIQKQEYSNWELIFWDNCSNDSSKQIIYNFKDKRIRYFSNLITIFSDIPLIIKKK